MSNAYTILVREREPSETERLTIVSAVAQAQENAHEAYRKFRAEHGLNE